MDSLDVRMKVLEDELQRLLQRLEGIQGELLSLERDLVKLQQQMQKEQ